MDSAPLKVLHSPAPLPVLKPPLCSTTWPSLAEASTCTQHSSYIWVLGQKPWNLSHVYRAGTGSANRLEHEDRK